MEFGCKIKVADSCDSRYSILPFGAIKKICFIFIKHIYLALRSGFHFISINMIFTIEADFRLDIKWKILHLESHRFAILFWRLDCYPATGSKFCAILLTNYWAHITFPHIYNGMMYTLELVGNFMQIIENDRSPWISLCNFDFGHCKLYFSLLALCMRNALKWQYLVVVGAKPFPANQNVKYGCFHWASKYSKLLAGSVETNTHANFLSKKVSCPRH